MGGLETNAQLQCFSTSQFRVEPKNLCCFLGSGVIESILALNDPTALSDRPQTIASRRPRLCGSLLQGPLCSDWTMVL